MERYSRGLLHLLELAGPSRPAKPITPQQYKPLIPELERDLEYVGQRRRDIEEKVKSGGERFIRLAEIDSVYRTISKLYEAVKREDMVICL